MGGETPNRVTAPAGAVFLSYASQDAEAARKICDALRTAGIEVWFDQSELRGGDAWDRQIRERIHDCRLFIPVISANSERRDEGYFRREWALAADRTRDMAHKRAHSGIYHGLGSFEGHFVGVPTSVETCPPVGCTGCAFQQRDGPGGCDRRR